MKNFQFLFLAILMTGLGSCVKKGGLQEGTWRGELALAGDRRAPFLFEVKKQGTDSATFTLINGEERVELPGAAFHGDTLIVPIVAYDAVLKDLSRATTLRESLSRITSKTIPAYLLPLSMA